MCARDAAAFLGVPIKFMVGLRRFGVYKQTHKPDKDRAFHKEDLLALEDRILSLAKPVSMDEVEMFDYISLVDVFYKFRFYSEKARANFFLSLVESGGDCIGRLDDSIASVHFDKVKVREFIRVSLEDGDAGSLTAIDASKVLDCAFSAISALVDEGFLLSERKTNGKRRISTRSILAFKSKYIFLSSISRAAEFNYRNLTSLCVLNEVPMLEVKCVRGLKEYKIYLIERTSIEVLKSIDSLIEQRVLEYDHRAKKRKQGALLAVKSYFSKLASEGKDPPMNLNGSLNIKVIARESRVCRSSFYQNEGLKRFLKNQ